MSGVQSIERAFSVLRVLARGPLGVTDIAERAELPKSTVSRLLAALEAEGAVEQVEVGGGYAIGPALAMLGASANPSAGLRSVIRPFIEELAMLTGGSAGFTIREGDSAYWVDNVDDDGDALVLLADQTGQSFPLHSIPSGIAMLSKMSTQAVEEYVARASAANGEPIDVELLRRRIGRVGSDGVVVSREDLDAGVNAVAAAFRGPNGEWEGALYLQGPSFRFPDDGDEHRVAKLVSEAAMQLSERLANG
ncbi:MAG: IclR family transcriptional regulator [Ilumatobacter sp.]|uniref:IclR family transcriptional regulator n=1 Tax=Ilumatobacter sp. TaxID=1967498 RepID=UPI003299E019